MKIKVEGGDEERKGKWRENMKLFETPKGKGKRGRGK